MAKQLALRLEVRTSHGLSHHRRLRLTLDLHGDLGDLLDDVRLQLLHADQLRARANTFADVDGAEEAHAVQAVVDPQPGGQTDLDSLPPATAAHDERGGREGPEAMGDGAAEWSALARSGSTWIHWWSPVASANWSISS